MDAEGEYRNVVDAMQWRCATFSGNGAYIAGGSFHFGVAFFYAISFMTSIIYAFERFV